MDTRFAFLLRFFFRRFFEGGSPIVAFVLAALPGTILSILLLLKYSAIARVTRKITFWDPWTQSVPDKYVFLVLAVVVTGLVALLRWDTLFPDRRDHANLAPLPVELRTVFLAKVTALSVFALAFVIDVSIGSTIVFPAVVLEEFGTLSDLLRFMGAHACAMFAAGLWAFTTVLALTGLIAAALPYRMLRSARRLTQFAGVISLIALTLSTPSALKQVPLLSAGAESWATWLPVTWFLGLYEAMLGRTDGALAALGERALLALATSLTLAVVSYSLSYSRVFLRSAEAVDGGPSALRIPDIAFVPLDATVLRETYQRACFRFIVKTVARSDRHSAAFASILGLGASVALVSLLASGRWTEPIPLGGITASLVLIYALTTAFRVSFGIPADPESNWVFRVAADPCLDARAVAQRALAIFTAPVIGVASLVFAVLYDPLAAALYCGWASLVALLLIEALTSDFRALPFTCAWLPAQEYPVFALAVWIAGLFAFGQTLAGIGFLLLRSPGTMVVILALGFGGLILHRRRRVGQSVAWGDHRGEYELLRLTE